MNRLYEYIAERMIGLDIIKPDDKDVIIYGLDMVLYTIISLSGLVLFGALFGLALPTALMLLIQIPMQSYGGGYHAKTHLRCFLTMTAAWAMSMLMYVYFPAMVILLLSLPFIVVLWILAPIEHVNAPMSAAKKDRMRKRLRVYLSLLTIALTACAIGHIESTRVISLAILNCGISVTAAVFSPNTIHTGAERS